MPLCGNKSYNHIHSPFTYRLPRELPEPPRETLAPARVPMEPPREAPPKLPPRLPWLLIPLEWDTLGREAPMWEERELLT